MMRYKKKEKIMVSIKMGIKFHLVIFKSILTTWVEMRRNWTFTRLCTLKWWDWQEMLLWQQIWCLILKTESLHLKCLVWILWLTTSLRHGWLRWTIIHVCSYRVLYWQGSYRTWLRMRLKLLLTRCFLLLWTYRNRRF